MLVRPTLSATEDLVELDSYLEKQITPQGTGNAASQDDTTPVAATKTVQLCIQVPDDGKPGDTITVEAEGQHLEIALPDNAIAGMELTVDVEIPNTAEDRLPSSSTTSTTSTVSRRDSIFTRLANSMTKPHQNHGLTKRLVVPAIMFVLALVVAMCGNLAALTQGCQGHWDGQFGQWCPYQSFPLLTTLPGSTSACACAVVYVRPADSSTVSQCAKGYYADGSSCLKCNETLAVNMQTGCEYTPTNCSKHTTALTQLHDEFVNADSQVTKTLLTLIHNCSMQNSTQTVNILATKMDSVTMILLGSQNSTVTSKRARLNIRGLKTKNLLAFKSQGVPFANPSTKSFEVCTKLADLNVERAGWTSIANGTFSTLVSLVSLHLRDNKLVDIPNLEANTKLISMELANNLIRTIPSSLKKNTALTTL